MGEVFNALEALNRTMRLGLTAPDLLRAEMGFKSALARQGNPDPTVDLPDDPIALTEGYELVATLQPRAEALSLSQLSTFARKELRQPRTKVDARTLKQIDKALQAVPSKGTAGAAKSGTAKKAPAAKATAKKAAAKKTPARKGGT
ncbi:MAG: hypothetical protein ACRD1D_09795 [Acidimicrobiales bacterium]